MGFCPATCPERFPHFDSDVVVNFVAWALSAECAFEATDVDLMDNFHGAMVTYCGESWIDTWWSSIHSKEGVLNMDQGTEWVRGNLKPASFLEFAMQTELFLFVKARLEGEIVASPNTPRSPKLLFYTLLGNAMSQWDESPFIHHSPKSWQEFARFLLRNGFSANAMLQLEIHKEGDLMDALYDYVEANDSGDSDSDARDSKASDSKASNIDVSDSDAGDGESTGVPQVSIFHLALAIACSQGERYKVVYRLDMLRVLVEEGGNASLLVSNFRNYWSRDGNSAVQRSAIHYLLSCRLDSYIDIDTEGDAAVLGALHWCITAILDHGADPEAVDSNGTSILELALEFRPHHALAEIMLDKGARVTPKLLLDSGEPRKSAGEILDKPRWRMPKYYTPEARRIAARYNPHWETRDVEEPQRSDSEPSHGEGDSNILGTVGSYVGNLVGSLKDWTSQHGLR